MPQIYGNCNAGTITDNPLSAVATTINSSAFQFLPTIASPDFLWLTLDPTGVGGLPEVVKVTAHTAAATSITVIRYALTQTGVLASSGRTHALNTVWRHSATSFDWDNAANPAGTIRATIKSTADPGWLLFNQTIVGGQTLYPSLWAAIPAAWKSGADIVLPNLADKLLGGAGTIALGATGGANSKTIATANLPAHTHTVDPPSTSVAISDPGHQHDAASAFVQPGAGTVFANGASSGQLSNDTTQAATTGITASVDIASFASGSTGSGTALDTTPAQLAVVYQIKAH